jgi:hypothetical protein
MFSLSINVQFYNYTTLVMEPVLKYIARNIIVQAA